MPNAEIEGVAIRHEGHVYCLAKPKRHHDVIKYISDKLGEVVTSKSIQGFYDTGGKFLNRSEAKARAIEVGQLAADAGVGNMLFSEDLW